LVIGDPFVPSGFERRAVGAFGRGAVPEHRHPRFEERDAAIALNFDIGVPHQFAEDEQRFVAGFAQDVLLGLAQ